MADRGGGAADERRGRRAGGRTGSCASWSPCTATCPAWPRRTPTSTGWCGWSRTAPGRRSSSSVRRSSRWPPHPPTRRRGWQAAIGAAPLAPVLAAAAQNRRPMSVPGLGVEPEQIAVAPIMVGHDVVAHLVTVRTPGRGGEAGIARELDDDLNLLLTEHAATVCGIILGRERAVAAAGARARSELIEGLLLARDRDDGEAERWAGHLGFLVGVEHHVFAVAILDGAPAR